MGTTRRERERERERDDIYHGDGTSILFFVGSFISTLRPVDSHRKKQHTQILDKRGKEKETSFRKESMSGKKEVRPRSEDIILIFIDVLSVPGRLDYPHRRQVRGEGHLFETYDTL